MVPMRNAVSQGQSVGRLGKVMIGGSILEPPLGEYSRGGAFCGDEGDPDGMFSYSVSKDKSLLTLTADASVCYEGLIEGTWTREK